MIFLGQEIVSPGHAFQRTGQRAGSDGDGKPPPMKFFLPACLAIFAFSLAGCARKKEVSGDERAVLRRVGKEAGDAARRDASKTLAGARLSGGQIQVGDAQGRPLYRIAAREIQAIAGTATGTVGGAVALDGRATLFQKGVAESGFRADKIQLFNGASGARLEMTGHVVATSQNATGAPVEVRAPRADVDVQKRLLVASGGAIARRGAVTLRVPQLSGQSSLRVLSCRDALVNAPDAQIQAKTATFNWGANRLSAGGIHATRPGLKLTGDHLDADTLASRGVLTGHIVATSTGKNGTAHGERLDFDWKRDRLFVPDATLQNDGATARMTALSTDSKLRVSDAKTLRISQNGATLSAQAAHGLDRLSQVTGSGIVLTRGDLRLEAARAQARDWSKASAVIVGSGGVKARNRSGTLSAQNATWTGDARSGQVSASQNVVIRTQGGVLRGQNAQSDAHFQNAEMSGNVSGALRDGTRIRAGVLHKRGENIVATGGSNATLPDGTLLRANRVEAQIGSKNAIASGGASGQLPDGTTFSAERVEKRGENILATGGASGQLPDKTQLHASRVEKRGQNVVATGNVRADLPSGQRTRGFGRVEIRAARVEGALNGPRWNAGGGVVLSTQSGAVVHAPRVSLDRSTGHLTASGGVSVYDPARGTLTGDSLVADLNRKTFALSNARGQTKSGVVSGKGLF